ncbi:MAG TPA: class I SAM-dependent methyltransferase [Tepidisphaeraceae bacterium]|nr:class I SAM-dependent methyltransferase [Tepidisphaeraceae bacterium]
MSSVRTGYDRWASIYDHEENPLQALEGPAVRAALGELRDLHALDLGCGTGRHSLWLAANGARVTALDFSAGMMAEAKSKPGAGEIRFIEHDLHRPIPLESIAFDVVVSGLVLEHINELDPFFHEIARVAKRNARVVISTLHPAMFFRGTQARFTDPESGELVQPGSIPHSVGAIVMSARRAGFDLKDIVESAPDAQFAKRFPRAEKYVGWPMLLLLSLVRSSFNT